jgi:hypothetical protein
MEVKVMLAQFAPVVSRRNPKNPREAGGLNTDACRCKDGIFI